MLRNINWREGTVLYNNFKIKKDVQLQDQLWELNEDLLQVEYKDDFSNKYLIDVGWYPEFDKRGELKIVIVKNYDWCNPVFTKTCGLEEAIESIETSAKYVYTLMK